MNKTYLRDQLIIHEGVRLKPYRDSVHGKLTIGVGRNLDDVGISHEEAMYLLNNDIDKAISQAYTLGWFTALNSTRKMIIVDMIFNLGLTGVKKFKKMIAAIQAEDWDTAADEMINSKWAKQVGRRAKRLSAMMKER